MSHQTIERIYKMKQVVTDLEARIATTLIDFKTFTIDNCKNANMTIQKIFAR